MAKQSNTMLLVGVLAIAFIIISAGAVFLWQSGVSAVVGLPMLAVGAVIVLIILLCSMAIVFASFDLHDKAQALALPEGSVRAVIAMMLIVLFAILSIYLFGSLATGEIKLLTDVPNLQAVNLLKQQLGEGNVTWTQADDGQRFKVFVRQGASPEGVDFAKQLLVLVGTLVTSIASFYFGSKAAIQANEAASKTIEAPVVDTLMPILYSRGAGVQPFTLQGRSLERITGVKIALNGKQVAATDVKATANQVTFKLDVPANQPPGVYALLLSDSKFNEQVTTQSLTVS